MLLCDSKIILGIRMHGHHTCLRLLLRYYEKKVVKNTPLTAMYFCCEYAVICCSCCSVDRFSTLTMWFSHHPVNTVRPQCIWLRGMEIVTPDVAPSLLSSSLSLSSCKTYKTFVVPTTVKCFYILFNQQQGQLTSDVLLTSNSVSVIFPEKIPREVVFSHFNNIFSCYWHFLIFDV